MTDPAESEVEGPPPQPWEWIDVGDVWVPTWVCVRLGIDVDSEDEPVLWEMAALHRSRWRVGWNEFFEPSDDGDDPPLEFV